MSVAAPAAPTGARAFGAWWRRAWVWFALAAVLVIITVATALRQDPDARPLGSDSARPEGGRAVVQVLTDHGVTVHAAASLPQALALAAEHPEAPVLFHDPAGYLPEHGLSELAEQVEPRRRVLVEPDAPALDALAPGVSLSGEVPAGDPLSAGENCRLPAALGAGTVLARGHSYRVDGAGHGCFPVPGTAEGPDGGPAAHAVVGTGEGTAVLGNAGMVANSGVDAAGHAVLALRTLGRSPDLIWYLPSLADVTAQGGTPTLGQLLPGWVRPAGLWLVICLVVLLLVKGRRHGPLAVEPLPVIVPASETAVGRARLYQRTGQHREAARALRAATLVRLGSALRLGPAAPEAAVSSAAAAVTGRDPAATAAVLDVDGVGSSRELIAAAAALQDLEDEVQRSLRTPDAAPETAPDVGVDADADERTP